MNDPRKSNPDTDFRNGEDNKDLGKNERSLGVSGECVSGSNRRHLTSVDQPESGFGDRTPPEVIRIISTWEHLPDHVKTSILTLIDAVMPVEGKREDQTHG